MAIAFSHVLFFLAAAAASAQDDGTVLLQRMQAVHFKVEKPNTTEQKTGQVPSRRIQYLFEAQAGLLDRIFLFTFLNNLARVHNATAHIPGGRFSARRHLTSNHSPVIAEDWGVYFDVNDHNGNPFHAADENMTGCKTIATENTSWYKIFDDGSVNIMLNLHRTPGLPKGLLFNALGYPSVSAITYGVVSQAFSQAATSPREYGFLHVRRCDRLSANAQCTEPEFVEALVAASSMTTWLVFTYAESGYLPALKRQLRALQNKTFFYEEDLQLDVAGDNYLLFAAVLVLRGLAGEKIDQHLCNTSSSFSPSPSNSSSSSLSLRALNVQSLERRGVCRGSDALGPYSLSTESSG